MELSQQTLEFIWRACTAIGAILIAAAATIEPEPGAWLWAIAGAFLAISVGRDRSLPKMAGHLALGTFIGVAIAALLTWEYGTPRAPVAFLVGLFGVDLSAWFTRQVRDGTLLESIGKAISALRGK